MYFLFMRALQRILQQHCIKPTSTKQLRKYFKIANSEMRSKITKLDKQGSMDVQHALF